MAVFAESFVLRLELPYSEYWFPLVMGMGVGLVALTVSRVAFVRKSAALVPVPKAEPKVQYDPFTQGSTTEQRKSVRRQGNPTGVHLALPSNKNNSHQGWVLDRSMGGLCLQVDQEYAPGTQLAVLPVNAPTMTHWVDIEVRACRKLKSGYELGCQFIKTPSWSILLMFG